MILIEITNTGDTGIICAVDGQPIYRKTFFVADANAEDVLIAHTNGDAIREANGQNTAVKLDRSHLHKLLELTMKLRQKKLVMM